MTIDNIIGPIDNSNWNTLVLLRESINWYKQNNSDSRYSNAIAKDTLVYREYLSKYV